jgi:short-subunit dehydrogenase
VSEETERVFVTGASSGIGEEVAVAYGRRGARVALSGRDAERLERAAERVRNAGGEALVLRADVAVAGEAGGAVAEAAERWGGLDVTLVNAGVTMAGRFADMTPETIERMVRVNLVGAAWTARAALPPLLRSRGRLVFVSSVAGLVGIPGRSMYSASKSGLGGLADALREEVRDGGVSVTLVCPGFVDTPIARRALLPDGRPRGAGERRVVGRAMSAEACARAVVRAADRRRRRVVLTSMARLLTAIHRVSPRLASALVRRGADYGP